MVFVLLQQGQKFFAVEGQAHAWVAVLAQLLHPDLNLCRGNLPVLRDHHKAGFRLAARQNFPPVQNIGGRVALEIIHGKQPGAAALGGEHQQIIFLGAAQGELGVLQSRGEKLPAQSHGLAAAFFVSDVQKTAQLLLSLGKGFPGGCRPLPEGFLEPGQRQTAAAVLHEALNVRGCVDIGAVAGVEFQGAGEIPQGRALLVQIIVGVAQPEIPAVGVLQRIGMRLHQPDGPAEQGLAFGSLGIGQVVAGPGQLHIGGSGPFLRGQGFEGVENLLVLIMGVPDLALFQQSHGVPPWCPIEKSPQKVRRGPAGARWSGA